MGKLGQSIFAIQTQVSSKLATALSYISILFVLGCGGGSESVVKSNPDATLTISSVAITEGDTAILVVSLSRSADSTVTFSWSTGTLGSDTTKYAEETADFTPTSGTVTIATGEDTATISVPTIDDTLPEGTETMKVQISSASGVSVTDDVGLITISDNDVAPNLSIDDVVVAEGGVATYTVTADAVSGQNMSFNWTIAHSTTTNSDFTQTAGGGVTIPAGSTSVTFNVPTNDDSINEPSETFSVVLSGAVYAAFTDNVGAGTITDNDVVPSLSVSDVSITEGQTASFTVSLNVTSEQVVTFDWTSVNGSAVSGSDYTASSAAGVAIPAGTSSVTITVPTSDDTFDETDENFTV
ncbi:MAG: hypothetical protein KDD25_03190, partial [Bdellovibrionales bacterium]|nr:hypothetical protein [Bdellovibrionales bacterium]